MWNQVQNETNQRRHKSTNISMLATEVCTMCSYIVGVIGMLCVVHKFSATHNRWVHAKIPASHPRRASARLAALPSKHAQAKASSPHRHRSRSPNYARKRKAFAAAPVSMPMPAPNPQPQHAPVPAHALLASANAHSWLERVHGFICMLLRNIRG